MEPSKENTSFSLNLQKILGPESPNDNLYVKIAIGLILVVIVAWMYPYGETIDFSYSVGSVWADKDIIAPFSFPIYRDQHEYEKEKQSALRSVSPIFDRNDAVAQAATESLNTIVDFLGVATDAHQRWLKTHAKADSVTFDQSLGKPLFPLSPKEWSILFQWRAAEKRGSAHPFRSFKETLANLLEEVYRVGVIDQAKIRQAPTLLALRKGTTEEIIFSQKIYDVEEAQASLQGRIASTFNDNVSASIGGKLLRSVLRPNLLYNQNETSRAIQIAEDNVPRTIGFVQENERIVSMHDRITEEIKLRLDSFQRAKVERGSIRSQWSQRVGIVFHITLILSLYTIYIFLFRKKIYHNNAMLGLIALLLLMEMFFGYLSLRLNVEAPIQYLIVVPAASMLLTIIFDSRVAFYGTVTMAFLIAGIRGNDYSIALGSLVAGALGAYTVRDIRNRTQIFRSLIFIFIGYSLTIIALALERYESFNTVTAELTFALANAVISPVLTYGLLIFFERIFKVTTDLTLLELSDFNHPLLRLLSEKAPGTFHHSMTIGNLAEAAADAVGADSILARVGAYYHDIGKMEKPEYFVENQVSLTNRHTRLRPRMSALIISSHVKEGIELGRQYGLPQKVLDFIPQHHGTTRMSFFFDKALKQAAARKNPKDIVREEDFRYPGPKPQSKETGIVMLADSVEASTRSIKEMTSQKLEFAIENMIKQRFVEGQLDECELTLRDLTKIKEAFLKILTGIHHQRIAYPEQEKLESKAIEESITEPKAITSTIDEKPIMEEPRAEEVDQPQEPPAPETSSDQ
jgi:putative nucleotidyltransferase with HDIG domain